MHIAPHSQFTIKMRFPAEPLILPEPDAAVGETTDEPSPLGEIDDTGECLAGCSPQRCHRFIEGNVPHCEGVRHSNADEVTAIGKKAQRRHGLLMPMKMAELSSGIDAKESNVATATSARQQFTRW